MGRKLTTAKMNLSDSQRAAALATLQKLAYAKSETEYNSMRDNLHANFPASYRAMLAQSAVMRQ